MALQKLDAAIGSDVFNISVVAPLQTTGGIAPILSITKSSSSIDGYLSSTDWNTFNNKQNTVSLTTTGSSGPSTFNSLSGALNIPNYSAAFSGFVPITRTLTINGVGQDLSADRTWTIDTLYNANGSLAGNRTVTMGAFTLSFEKDIKVNGLTIGKGNGSYLTNTAIGFESLNSTTSLGTGNVGLGYQTLKNTTSGDRNVAIGVASLFTNITGRFNIGIGNAALNRSTGNFNIGIGGTAAYTLVTGDKNIFIGNAANTSQPGVVTGSYNTIIGNDVSGLASNLSNNIILADGQGNIRIATNAAGETVIGSSAYPSFAALAKLHVLGAIQQDTVISSMIKANTNGVLVNAIANTDYLPVNNPIATGQFQLLGSGITSFTPYINTLGAFVSDVNDYQLFYIQNKNSGSDASADFVAYNDVSAVDSFFIDMGINSSNYSSVIYPIFPANSGYVFTGGGTGSSQPSHLYMGTSTPNSDVVLFAGGINVPDTVITVKGATKNVLIGTGTITDTGEKVQIIGNVKVDSGDIRITGGGAYADGSMLGDPHQLTTKEYVDNQVAAGIHVHQPVRVETAVPLTATYTQGGTTPTITDITLNKVLTSVAHSLLVDDIIVFNTTSNGITAGLTYFVYQVLSPNTFTISESINGPEIDTLTNGTGLTLTSRANSGVGATLVNAGAQAALVIDGISVVATDRVLVRDQVTGYWNGVYVVNDPGSPTTNWVLERSADTNKFGSQNPNSIDGGSYFYVTDGLIGIGESYVVTNVGDFIIGTDTIIFTLFSASPAYFGTAPISVVGQNIQLTGIVAPVNGGTGVGTVAIGDLLYGSAANVWSKLPLGVAYKSLIVNASGTNVEWNAVPLNQSAAVSGQLAVANGGTGALSLTGVLIGNGTSAITDITGTANQLLRRNSGNTAYEFFTPSYVTYSSFTAVSPILYNGAGQYSIQVANTSQDGYLSSTDWNTFNGKQAQINGTGFVKASGTVISYDNSTYVPTSRTLTINGVSHDLSVDRSWSVGTVTSVSGTGTVSGLTLSGTVTSSGSLTLGGSLTLTSLQITTGLGYTPYNATNPSGFVSSNIYTSDGTLAGDRYINANNNNLWIDNVDTLRVSIGASGSTNVAALFEGVEPNITVKALGASNSASLFLSPSAGFNGSIHNRTGGGLEFYTGATPSVHMVLQSTGQLRLNAYTSTSSFSGTAAGYLGFDTSGNIITVSAGGGGTVTSVATTGPITGGTITTSGTIGITQATTSTDGYLSSTDWNTFNGKVSSNIYTANGTLTGNRTILTTSGFTLTLNPQTNVITTLTASGSGNAFALLGQNFVTYGAGFSSSNLGLIYSAIGGLNYQTFNGSATFANSNLTAANVSVNAIDFSSAGSTITMTQATAPGIRAMSGHQNGFQYQGTNSGTITHAAISQNLGFYRPPAATGTLTITNAYGFLLNPLDDYGSGFTFTNRWGIYQAGTADDNYFGSKVLIGVSLTGGIPNDAGAYNLQVGGQIRLNSYTSTSSYAGVLVGYLGFDSSGNIITVASSSGGNTIYTGDGTLSGPRNVLNGGNTLSFQSTVANSIPLQATGTAGVLFRVTDNSTGNILQVNNASGSQIYAIDVTGTIYQESPTYTFTGINTTTTLVTLSSSIIRSLFIEYHANNTSNGGHRAGAMIVVENGSTAEYTEYRTTDLTATTSGLVLSASISGSNVLVTGTITSGTWNIKLAVRAL